MRILRSAAALAVAVLLVPVATSANAITPQPRIDINAANSYVTSVYWDLFGRGMDQAAFMTWPGAVAAGTPRIAVANSITGSDEFRSGLITDAYDAYLGRGPDAAGLKSWLRAMSAGLTIEQLDAGFIASDEYWALAGGTAADWVRALYADVLGREAGASEVAAWVARLKAGVTRTQVAMGFLLSTEYLSSVVDGYYWWLLDRGLDPSGLRTWVSAIQNGARDEQIIGGIIASDEYWNNESTRPGVSYIIMTPRGEASVPLGAGLSYSVEAYQRGGGLIGDVTNESLITWDGQPCAAGYCQPTTPGQHEIRAIHRGLNDWATLTVVATG